VEELQYFTDYIAQKTISTRFSRENISERILYIITYNCIKYIKFLRNYIWNIFSQISTRFNYKIFIIISSVNFKWFLIESNKKSIYLLSVKINCTIFLKNITITVRSDIRFYIIYINLYFSMLTRKQKILSI